ncbi:hypothetical protein ES708_22311 [subsurface metagenome]
MKKKEFIQEYLNRGFSLIPLKNNSKVPAIRWKKYQYKKASLKEIEKWFITFNDPNIALITGKELIVIDLDDIEKLSELMKILPEINKTTRVTTKRGYHFYFSNNGKHKIRSINNLFNLGIELKANGKYVLGPPSNIDDFTYNFKIPLSEIQPIPKKIIEYLEETLPGTETGIKESGQAPGGVEYRRRKALSLPRYSGLDKYCIEQILGRDLKAGERGNKGERNNSLYILYGLLCQNKNRSDHSKKIVIIKNNSLSRPLTDEEMKKLFRRRYNFKCFTIREILPYIECDKCKFKFKGGVLRVGNIIVKNIMEISKLNTCEKAILLLLGTVFEGEKPSISKIALKARMNYQTVQKAIDSLKKKGVIDKSLYK